MQLLEYLYPKQVDCIYIDPPYNSRAKDWKYSNDYVDPTDSYRHSKWLSMMQRRLKIAKRILNPQNSVLIVTIDEKEYLHLGCLLEDMFPEAHIQMVSSVINPKGSARDGFSRSDEYIFFVMFGECTPARLPLSNEWSSSAIVSAQEKTGDDEAEKSVEPGWTSMMRRGTDSMRTDSPNLYYPIYVDPDTRTIKEIGTSVPMGQDRAEEIPGLIQVLPLRRNGTQGRWQVGNVLITVIVVASISTLGVIDNLFFIGLAVCVSVFSVGFVAVAMFKTADKGYDSFNQQKVQCME